MLTTIEAPYLSCEKNPKTITFCYVFCTIVWAFLLASSTVKILLVPPLLLSSSLRSHKLTADLGIFLCKSISSLLSFSSSLSSPSPFTLVRQIGHVPLLFNQSTIQFLWKNDHF